MPGIWGLEGKKIISSEDSGAALREKGEGRIKSFTSHSTLVAECCEVGSRYARDHKMLCTDLRAEAY